MNPLVVSLMCSRSNIGLLLLLLVIVSSCNQKSTCPAFQSQYILDEETLKQKFSLFESNSKPKNGIGDVKKNKYGISAVKSHNFKYNEFKKVEMITIYPEYQDTILMARNLTDSLSGDSIRITSSRYLTTFNNDQLIYNTLFGSLRRPRSSGTELFKKDLEVQNKEGVEKEEEKAGFFKRIFGKKKKKRKEKELQEQAEFGEPYEEDKEPVEENIDDGFN